MDNFVTKTRRTWNNWAFKWLQGHEFFLSNICFGLLYDGTYTSTTLKSTVGKIAVELNKQDFNDWHYNDDDADGEIDAYEFKMWKIIELIGILILQKKLPVCNSISILNLFEMIYPLHISST